MLFPSAATLMQHMDQSTGKPPSGSLGTYEKFLDYGLEFQTMSGWNPGDPLVISSWADASWVDNLVTHKSSYRYCMCINGCLVLWQSCLTPQVAHSMTEAEYVAMDEAAKEMVHLTMLLKDLGFTVAKSCGQENVHDIFLSSHLFQGHSILSHHVLDIVVMQVNVL